MKCPCKGCEPPKRTLTCHGFCEEYKEWRAARDEANRKRNIDHDNRQLSRDHEMKYRKNLRKGWK